MIGPNGVEKLCQDMEVPPEDVCIYFLLSLIGIFRVPTCLCYWITLRLI